MKNKKEVYQKIKDKMEYFVFEENNINTRCKLTNEIVELITLAKMKNIFTDSLVVCDERNNPQSVIDKNELNLDVYVKTKKDEEFRLVTFYALRTSNIRYDELIDRGTKNEK